jgi:predicted AAA+ superfamily ATPase
LATYLAGRYIQFQIHPLGYQEFLTFYDLENTTETLQKYLRIGGMPYLADNTGSLVSANNISKYLRNQKIKIPVQTVISYLAALEKSFIVRKVSRAEVVGLGKRRR